MALVPRFPPSFAGYRRLRALARLFVRIVRRRWSVRGRGVLPEASLQSLHAVVQLRHLVAQGAHIGLHGTRGLLPVLRGKGKRPDGVGGVRQWFHDVSSHLPQGQTTGRFIAEI
jgi:hypothetical protein